MSTTETPDRPSDGPDLAFVRRFGRQIIVPEIGLEGQRRLADAKVLVVGLGGLGSSAALTLASAGVGELHLIDPDAVEESNLPRQLLYGPADVGRPKAEVAEERLRGRDPRSRIRSEVGWFDAATAMDRVRAVDLVVDASDNFPSRYLVSDACVRAGRPDVFAAVHRLEGQMAVFDAVRGPCYRCLFPEPPPPDSAPSCGEAGVASVLPPLLGTWQATAAVQRLLGWGASDVTTLRTIDLTTLESREYTVRRRPDCEGCRPEVRHGLVPLSGPSAPPAGPPDGFRYIEPAELAAELRGPDPPTLIDVRGPGERAVVAFPGDRWIPVEQLADRLGDLAEAHRPVVYCQWGGRSERAGRLLAEAGLRPIRVLRGGLDAYAAEVDPSIPRI